MCCVRTKDHLIEMLNACTDADKLVKTCVTVLLPIFEHTAGLWKECSYCYKAAEIMDRAAVQCNRFLEQPRLHHKRIEVLERLKKKLTAIADNYRQIQTPV